MMYTALLISESEDTVQCVYCKLRISNWTGEMIPDVVHRKKSVHCQFMQGEFISFGNVGI